MSLRRRLVFAFGGSFVALTLISGLVIYALLARELEGRRDLIVEDRVSAVKNLLKSPPNGLVELKERVEKEWPLRGGEKVLITVTDAEDHVITQTPGAGPDGLSKTMTIGTENAFGLKGPLQVRVSIGQEEGLAFLNLLRDVLVAVFFFVVLVSLFTGWQVVSRQTRPLMDMADHVAKIDSENLHERLNLNGLPAEMHSLGQAFNHTMDRLEEAFERLAMFSSDLAHELRTPVANMMGSIEVALSRPRTDEEYRELLSSTMEECARISRMTDSLLFLARAESQARVLTLTPVNLKNEIESVLEFFEPVAAEKKISIAMKISAPEQTISAEVTLFQRALSNLIANAIQYTPAGGHVEINVNDGADGKDVEIAVADNGQGIPAKDLSKIFDRFYRVDPSRNLNSGGTGLGLAIVKSILELHQGKIEVKSEPGQGARFTMKWPKT